MGARRVSRTHALAFLLSLISVGAVLVLHDGQAWPAPWPASAAFAGGASATNQELPRRRGKVYVRWGMAAGLCNQLNSHVNGLVLALALGADAAVLPWNTMYRTSFNHSKGVLHYAQGLLDCTYNICNICWPTRACAQVEDHGTLPLYPRCSMWMPCGGNGQHVGWRCTW